jgi:hypothetical protein
VVGEHNDRKEQLRQKRANRCLDRFRNTSLDLLFVFRTDTPRASLAYVFSFFLTRLQLFFPKQFPSSGCSDIYISALFILLYDIISYTDHFSSYCVDHGFLVLLP